MKNFKELRIWQQGFQIVLLCFRITRGFPSSEKFGLTAQITRAAVSIPSNIAEGSSRNSDRDNKRFIDIALGSAFELETQLMIARELNFGDALQIELALKMIAEECKLLHAFGLTLSAVKS